VVLQHHVVQALGGFDMAVDWIHFLKPFSIWAKRAR